MYAMNISFFKRRIRVCMRKYTLYNIHYKYACALSIYAMDEFF